MKAWTCVSVVLLALVGPSVVSAQTPAPSLSKELVATYQRASKEMFDMAEAMPAEKYSFKPTPETIALLKKSFQSVEDMITPFSDAQLLEPVKFPIGDRTVTRATFWQGPMYQIRNHYGQLVVYLRMNGIVPPASVRR